MRRHDCASAHVVGDVLARDITVFGRCAGQLVATDVVDLRAEATVTGRIVTRRFILTDGASFNGRPSRSIWKPRFAWPG